MYQRKEVFRLVKKNKVLLNAAFGIILCIIVIPCLFLLGSKVGQPNTQQAEVYYLVNPSNTLKSIDVDVTESETVEAARTLLEKMKEQPKKDGMVSAVPHQVDFLSVRLENQTAYVDVSASYLALRNAQEVVCRSALVWTLTSLPDIQYVQLSVEGRNLRTDEGVEVGAMNRENVCIDAEISAETTEYAILQLYFTNSSADAFMIEDRVVEVNANQAREKTILEQLIAGPLESGYYPTVSPDVKIREVTTTDDGICYVNLSQDFLTKPAADSVSETLVVYSIVNSLCELDNVDKVQFLVEGEKIENLQKSLDYSKPFTAVSDITPLLTNTVK